MTRTTMYVAVLCLGVGLFAGFGLRNNPPSYQESNSPVVLELRMIHDPLIREHAFCKIGREDDGVYRVICTFRNEERCKKASSSVIDVVLSAQTQAEMDK